MFAPTRKNAGNSIGQRIWILILSVAFVAACSTAPRTVQDRTDLRQEANSALSQARSGDAGFDSIIRRSPGYAVFPQVSKGGAGIGGAYGRGILYQNGTAIGYTDLSQATVGAQLGGQTYTQILVFENVAALNRFRQGNFEFSAQATAVALHSGESANARFQEGIAVFTTDEKGLMAEASVGGQKFSYQAFANR